MTELRAQNRTLQSIRDQLDPLRDAIRNYASESELSGAAISAHKDYLTTGHIPTINRLGRAIDTLMSFNRSHIDAINTNLRDDMYSQGLIRHEFSLLNRQVTSTWFPSYERQNPRSAQEIRDRLLVVRRRGDRLQNYLSATNGIYEFMATVWLGLDRQLARIDNKVVCPQTGHFMLPTWEAVDAIMLMERVIELAGPFACIESLLDEVERLALAGCPHYAIFAADPVNTATGNFVYAKEDISIPGRYPLEFKRFYNNIGGLGGVLGIRWTHNYNIQLYAKDEESVQIVFGDGHMESYNLNDDGTYRSQPGIDNVLKKKESHWELRTPVNEIYKFDRAEGYLKSISDLNSIGSGVFFDTNKDSTELSYADGLLVKAKNSCGSLSFYYDSNSHLTRITDHTGREVEYEYADDLLIKVTDPTGAVNSYEYGNENGNLSKITNPIGVEAIKNEYDNHGRMISQKFADGGVYTFDYGEKITTATEQNGNVIRYEYDDKYRTVRNVYSDSEEQFEFNDENKRTKYVDRNGNVRLFEYDENGNNTKSTDPLGYETTIEYNEYNKPVQITSPNGGITSHEYDDKGNLTAFINPLGHAINLKNDKRGHMTELALPDGSSSSLTYDDKGNILSVKDNDGNETRYEYDGLNRAIKTTDAIGNETSFEYNEKGDITKVVNASGKERNYEYNASGKVIRITDFDGTMVAREYNEMGNPSRTVDGEGNETILEYDLMWNVSKQIDANGNATIFEYNKLNRLERATNAKGAVTRFEYDHNGNRTRVIGPMGEEVNFSYDALDRICSVTEPDGAKSCVEYDSMGQVTKITDAMGYATKFEYDKAGQKIREIDPSGRELNYSYTKLGKISEITDLAGRKTKCEYLPGGLLKGVVYPDGSSEEYSYDANKKIKSRKSQDGYTLNYEYDCLNQISRIYSNTGQDKIHTYDAVGNVTSVTDANGNTTKYKYSPNGNLTAVIDPLGSVSEHDYDKLGNLIETRELAELNEAKEINVQNSRLRVTRYEWDEIGQLEKIVDPLGNTEEYTYDVSGNVISKLDKEGFLTKYAYTLTNQVQEVVYADGRSVMLSYNPLKQLTEIKDWLGTTSIEVDELGRTKKVTDHNGKEVSYTFGTEGERKSITYPDGKVAEYIYDDSLRLKTLNDGNNKVEYSYDSNNRLSDKIFSSGVSTKYSYNDMGMLSELTHSDKDGVLDKYMYSYDKMVNKTGVEKYRRGLEEESGKYSFTYDALSRLTEVQKDGVQTKTFAYDELGNRDTMTDNGNKTKYTYNALNQLISTADTFGTEQDFSYDKRGNLTQVLENGKIKNTYEFSALNRLTKSINENGQIASYNYNGLGFRVGKQITDDLNPTKRINYVLDQTKQYNNLLHMSDETLTQSFIWDDNVAFADGNAYLQDELGSPLRYIDEMGGTIESYGYDEFGGDLYGNQGRSQPFGYTGYTADVIAGTYFAQAREYLPQAGRFAGEDAAKYGQNWYAYCNGNPLSYIDPTGLIECGLGDVRLRDWIVDRDFINGRNSAYFALQEALANKEDWGLSDDDIMRYRAQWVRYLHRITDLQLLTNSQVRALMGSSEFVTAVLIDVLTGLSFEIYMGRPYTHTDFSPYSLDDTYIVRSILNPDGDVSRDVWRYDRSTWPSNPSFRERHGILYIGGSHVAVGFHLTPHGSIIGNGRPDIGLPSRGNTRPSSGWPVGGHFCMYFRDSRGNANPNNNFRGSACRTFELFEEYDCVCN